MERLELAITGMTCDHCVRAVRDALGQVPSVRVKQVEIGRAVVAYDPAAATEDEIVDAVGDEGYEATRAG